MTFLKRLIIFFAFLVLYQINSVQCYGGNLEIADGFFYNDQFEKAISFYKQALNNDVYDRKTKTNIKYKIGLSYFLLGDRDKSVKYWIDAKKENPGIYDGKIYRIPSEGMEPQLIVGDHIIVDNDYYNHKKIQRGDVVVFLNPSDSKSLLIKRVMALPGEKIEIRNKALKVNNIVIFDKTANYSEHNYIPQRDDFGPLVIPKDSYFLLGDSRDKSFDSRFIGAVSKKFFVGKALVIYGSTPQRDSLEGTRLERSGMIIK